MSSVLNSVYNNYLTTYTPKTLTRYDTHKKSELRGVYNSIVKLNKEAPWYLPTTSRETQQYAVNLKENARALRNTIAQLGGLEEKETLQKKTAYSQDPDVVTAEFIGGHLPADASAGFTIEVQSLASPQENMGLFLSDELISMKPDLYSFDVSINDMNYEFQFSVEEDETNREIQERLSRLINNSSIGLKANVIFQEGRSALTLTSESQGLSSDRELIFTVSDEKTSKTKGMVEYLGLDYVSHAPSNASFLLNGEERSASSNHFTIGKLFEVELKGTSAPGKETSIGLKTDVESLTDNVRFLISGYNDFMKAATSYLESQSGSKSLVREMKGLTSGYRNELETMGLNVSEEGTISIDDRLLRQAALDAREEAQPFAGLKDFTSSLLRKSDQISLNPMNYVEKTIVAYKNPGHNFASPYTTSSYSGMMFNFYC